MVTNDRYLGPTSSKAEMHAIKLLKVSCEESFDFTNDEGYLINGRNGEANNSSTSGPHPKVNAHHRKKTAGQQCGQTCKV